MAHRRAIYAARFLRPPGWTKRLLLREKPRDLTGPFENPVRRWVRLREKAKQFCEIPPPRKIPVPKPTRRKNLQAVEGVPRVSPDALQRRLDFLLGPAAIEQQLSAVLRPGMTPAFVETMAWERQMRDIRRVYRAQYLQKLAEVTESERRNEAEMLEREQEERRRRKEAQLQRVGEEMKRRAILKDRKRIEAKVTEAMNMAKRSKAKRKAIFWFRRMENLSKLIVSAENFDVAFPPTEGQRATGQQMIADGSSSSASSAANSGVLLSRNVSVPFLLRQLGGAKGFPQQKSRRIPLVDNLQREILESSYELMAEDDPRFDPEPAGMTARDRANQLYSGFSKTEQLALLDQKIDMLVRKQKIDQETGQVDNTTTKLLDILTAAKLAYGEAETAASLKAVARDARGADPPGMLSGSEGKGGSSDGGA